MVSTERVLPRDSRRLKNERKFSWKRKNENREKFSHCTWLTRTFILCMWDCIQWSSMRRNLFVFIELRAVHLLPLYLRIWSILGRTGNFLYGTWSWGEKYFSKSLAIKLTTNIHVATNWDDWQRDRNVEYRGDEYSWMGGKAPKDVVQFSQLRSSFHFA